MKPDLLYYNRSDFSIWNGSQYNFLLMNGIARYIKLTHPYKLFI
jgi:hypothetical protein